MFFVVRSNDSFNFPLGWIQYTVYCYWYCYIFLIKKKKCKKNKKNTTIIGIATAALSVVLRGLPKADVGRRLNTKQSIAKPVAPFHHTHRTAVNNLLQSFHRRQLQIRYVLRCWLLINTGQYPRRRSEIPGTFWRHFRSQILEKPKICNKKVCYIRVLQCAYAPFRHLI